MGFLRSLPAAGNWDERIRVTGDDGSARVASLRGVGHLDLPGAESCGAMLDVREATLAGGAERWSCPCYLSTVRWHCDSGSAEGFGGPGTASSATSRRHSGSFKALELLLPAHLNPETLQGAQIWNTIQQEPTTAPFYSDSCIIRSNSQGPGPAHGPEPLNPPVAPPLPVHWEGRPSGGGQGRSLLLLSNRKRPTAPRTRQLGQSSRREFERSSRSYPRLWLRKGDRPTCVDVEKRGDELSVESLRATLFGLLGGVVPG